MKAKTLYASCNTLLFESEGKLQGNGLSLQFELESKGKQQAQLFYVPTLCHCIQIDEQIQFVNVTGSQQGISSDPSLLDREILASLYE
jgi:hypothetical protein